MSDTYVPQVDYTTRDFVSIKDDLLNVVAPDLFPDWTSRDDSDFGVMLVELFAYIGDILNFYIDRSANEAFLSTASQRSSLLEIAHMLDYTPDPVQAATSQITFVNTSSASVTIPAGTQIATSSIVNGSTSQVVFETDSDLTIPYVSPYTGVVSATHGVTYADKNFGVSTGKSGQVVKIPGTPVLPDSVLVTIAGTSYQKVTRLIDYASSDAVFEIQTDEYENSYIIFGDGVTGRVPPAQDIIVTYRLGGGRVGNVSAGALKTILSSISGVSISTNSAATGGTEAESNDSIRRSIPFSFRAINRAVSLNDYASLAIQYPNVGKAIATGDGYNSITLYTAPVGDNGYTTTFGASVSSSATTAKLSSYLWTNIGSSTVGDTTSVVRTGQILNIIDGTNSETVVLGPSGSAPTTSASVSSGGNTLSIGTTTYNNPAVGALVSGTIVFIKDATNSEYLTVTGTPSHTSTATGLTFTGNLVHSYTSPTVYWVNFATGLVNNHASAIVIKSWDTDNFNNSAINLLTFFTDKTPPTTTMTVLPPEFVPINITLTTVVLPQHKQVDVKNDITNALAELLNYDNVTFADMITKQDISAALSQVPGVKYADITMMARYDLAQSGASNITCTTNEIPSLGTLNLTSTTGGIS